MFYFIFLKAAFEALGVIAVITNCALIGMAAKSAHWLPDMTPVNAVLLFVAIEVRITLVFFFFCVCVFFSFPWCGFLCYAVIFEGSKGQQISIQRLH